jgi:hypothetical protein
LNEQTQRNLDDNGHHSGDKVYRSARKAVSAFIRALILLNSSRCGAQLFAAARRGAE